MKRISLILAILMMLCPSAHASSNGILTQGLSSNTSGGSSGVSSFSGDGSFATNSTSTGSVTLTLGNAAAYSFWGNATGSAAAPGYTNSPEVLSLTTSGNLSVLGNANLAGTTTANNLTVTGTCTGCGSSAVTLANTTSNLTYYLGFTTSTSGTLSTLYGTAANLFFNPSTGILTALGVTTTTLTVNGNASLSGTTTLGTAQIGAGNATLTNLTATTVTGTTGNFPTLNFTNALGTTITATTLNGNATTATTATNATNVALTNSTSNVTYDLDFTTSSSGNVPLYANSGITANPSTGTIGAAAFSATTTTATVPTNGLYSPSLNAVRLTTSGISALYVTATQSIGVGGLPSNTTNGGNSIFEVVVPSSGGNLRLTDNGFSNNATVSLNETGTGGGEWTLQSEDLAGTGSLASGNFTITHQNASGGSTTAFGFVAPNSTSGQKMYTTSGGVVGWSSNNQYGLSNSVDTGLSRGGAATIDFGNGSASNTSATLNATLYNASQAFAITTTTATVPTTGIYSAASGSLNLSTTGASQASISNSGAVTLNTTNYASCSGLNTNSSAVIGCASATGTSNVPLRGSGGTPTCGTGCASINSGSTDMRGSMVSSSSVSAVTLNFSTTLGFTPTCVISDSNSTAVSDISAVSSSALTVSLASALSAVTIYWICVQ